MVDLSEGLLIGVEAERIESALAQFDEESPEGRAGTVMRLREELNLSLEGMRKIVYSLFPRDAQRVIPTIEKLMEVERLRALPILEKINRHKELDLEELVGEIKEKEPKLLRTLSEGIMGHMSQEKALEDVKYGFIPPELFFEKFKIDNTEKEKIEKRYSMAQRALQRGFDNDKQYFTQDPDLPEKAVEEAIKDVAERVNRAGSGGHSELNRMYSGMLLRKFRNEIRREIENQIEHENKGPKELEKHYTGRGLLWIARPLIEGAMDRVKEKLRKMKVHELPEFSKYKGNPKYDITVEEYLGNILQKQPAILSTPEGIKRVFPNRSQIITRILEERKARATSSSKKSAEGLVP
jgi:hypothetical protein